MQAGDVFSLKGVLHRVEVVGTDVVVATELDRQHRAVRMVPIVRAVVEAVMPPARLPEPVLQVGGPGPKKRRKGDLGAIVYFRLEQDLLAAVDGAAKAAGLSRSEALRDLVRRGLGQPGPAAVVPAPTGPSPAARAPRKGKPPPFAVLPDEDDDDDALLDGPNDDGGEEVVSPFSLRKVEP